MGGQNYQYDESGETFFSFLLSLLVLILIPGTFYYWHQKKKQDKEAQECHCTGCTKKKILLNSSDSWRSTKHLLIKLLIISGWLVLALLAYKVSQFDYKRANFDPYEILGVPLGTSQREIKEAYRKRKLSIILHADNETRNKKAFMKLKKAYKALIDDEARRNWEKYGNPDGPGAIIFGFALPSWIVEKENSVWVLGLYALVFMVALPVVVGTWWYRSIKFSENHDVLLGTSQMYYVYIYKTPQMALKRAIMILSASLEFDKRHNSEIVERLSDNEEVPNLITQLPNLGEDNLDRPLCFSYSKKARALLHAHLSRLDLKSETLEEDCCYIVGKCPYLIQELVNCVNQLILLAYAKRINCLPSIETIENCMTLSPMIVQGMWKFKSPLLQLPHISDDNLNRPIRSLQQLAQLRGEERRNILRNLSDEQYEDVMKVLGRMPYIDFQVRSEVIDDDEILYEVTAGAIVTVTVTLKRRNMSSLFGDKSVADAPEIYKEQEETNAGGDAGGDAEADAQSSSVEDDDQEWEKIQKILNKPEVLEVRSKVSHSVHCPLYPYDKQEYWWTYICDRKSRTLLTEPFHITWLVDEEDCQLEFVAPKLPGVYTFSVCLRSDSYMGFDQQKDIKLDVKEAPAIPAEHPQWEFEDSEDEI